MQLQGDLKIFNFFNYIFLLLHLCLLEDSWLCFYFVRFVLFLIKSNESIEDSHIGLADFF